jgi:uncharacterized protein
MDMILDFARSNAKILARISGGAQSLRGSCQSDEGDAWETGSIFKFSSATEKRRTKFVFDDEITAAAPYRKVSKRIPMSEGPMVGCSKALSKSPPMSSPTEETESHSFERTRTLSRSTGGVSTLTDPFADSRDSMSTNTSDHEPITAEQSIITQGIGDGDDIFGAISTRNHTRLQTFIDSDIDLSIRNQNGHSALSEAVHLGDIEACRMLILGRAGPEAQCHAKTCKHARPIHIAAMLNCTAVMQVLLDHGAKIGGVSDERRNALHWAAEHNSPDAGLFLIAAGLDHAAPDLYGDTPLHIAVTHRSTAFIRAYLTNNKVEASTMLEWRNAAYKTPVHLAVESGGVDGLQVLLEFGARIDLSDPNNATLLHYAARRSCHEAVHILVSRGLDVNARDRKGQTPLHYAVLSDFDATRTIRVLLDLGADLEAKQQSCIHVLRSIPNKQVPIMDAAGDVQQEGRWKKHKQQRPTTRIEGLIGRTPLLLAALSAPAPVVRCLIEAGAQLGVTSACGCGALALAKRNKDLSVFTLLMEALHIGRDYSPFPVQVLNVAVASGQEFIQIFNAALSALGLKTTQHGVRSGIASGVISRSSEGSCSYNDCSIPHIKAALAACDQAGISVHTRYQRLSALDRAIHCWQEGQEAMLELLLGQESGKEALAAIERAQALLRKRSQVVEGCVDPKYHDTYRLLGNKRNELIKQLADDQVKRQQHQMMV